MLLARIEYEVDVELNVTDVVTVDYLRSLLNNGSFSLTLGPTVNVTHIDITTGKNGASSTLNIIGANMNQGGRFFLEKKCTHYITLYYNISSRIKNRM